MIFSWLIFILLIGIVVVFLLFGVMMNFFISLLSPFREWKANRKKQKVEKSEKKQQRRFNKNSAEDAEFEEIKDKH